jgi:voltage-gated potassium channel
MLSVLLIFTVISVGTAGYALLEGWSILDSLFMTVITITTVGYREVHQLSEKGMLFTIFLILFSLGTVFYILNRGAKIIIEGELLAVLGRRRLEKTIKGMKNHYIICGYGRMGRIISKELKNTGISFVVIEKTPHETAVVEKDIVFMEGDATKDKTLLDAGIERAAGLISVLPTDAENLYVVLSTRGLNPKLNIVARAGEEGSEQKLIRAGADRVVSPYHIGGLRIAHMVLKPAVVDFIEFATKSGNIDLQMEEIYVSGGSKVAGSTLNECGIGRELGVIIVAIKDKSGGMKFNPPFNATMAAGDTLIALGETSRLKQLEEMAKEK